MVMFYYYLAQEPKNAMAYGWCLINLQSKYNAKQIMTKNVKKNPQTYGPNG